MTDAIVSADIMLRTESRYTQARIIFPFRSQGGSDSGSCIGNPCRRANGAALPSSPQDTQAYSKTSTELPLPTASRRPPTTESVFPP